MRPRLDRSVGRSFFGSDPATYDAARPGHADGVYDVLRDRCELRPGTPTLEIGPGTGQATRLLLELGADPLVAVEPDPALSDYLRATLGDRVDLRPTTLEDAQLDASSFRLSVAASSFHWVEEDAALAKLRDALQPGGWVAIWWTSYGNEAVSDRFRLAVDPLLEDLPHSPSGASEGRPSFGRDAQQRLAALAEADFEQLGHEELHWSHEWDAQGLRGLFSTFSPLSALEPERREELLDSVARIADTDFGGRVERELITSLYTARKPS
jgi:SAM-dependent methyltransferase